MATFVNNNLRSHRVVRKDGRLLLEEHQPPDILEFTPAQSQLVTYGIDYQSDPKFKRKTLSYIAGKDAKDICQTLKKTVGLPSSNVKHYIASRSPGNCTFEGIRRSFLEMASKVDTNGILIFSFTGHGLKIGERKFGLAPVDFNYRSETFITADVLINWLHFSRFQGQYVLFIFDCCFAGGISEQMVLSSVEADLPIPGLFVFTSCTAFESSLVVTSLGHSIFNYFLSFSLFNSYDSQNGRLAIKNVFENCDLYCIAFSSLLVSYDSNLQLLKWNMMQPEFKYFQLTPYLQSLFEESDEEVDAGEPGRFAFALKYYNFAKKSIVIIPDKCQGWLEVVSGTDGPLATLVKADLLEGALLSAAIGSMMYSMASIFVACGQPDISNRNVFMVAFIHVIAAIDRVLQGVAVTGRDMKLSIEYYFSVLEKHKIKSGELKKLYNSVCADVRKYEGEESIDSGEGSNEVNRELEIPVIDEWLPADWDE